MNKSIKNNNRCTGCGVCATICPKDAILWSRDKKGFKRPEVNDNCIECGLCVSKCHEHKGLQGGHAAKKAFTAYSSDRFIRNSSSSGGIFSEIALRVINQGGFVCAAGFNDDHVLCHQFVFSTEGLEGLRKSKYLESDVTLIWKELKSLLSKKNGLFVGTPCQCAALHAFLGKDAENLLICDFICHGVASPLVFEKFKTYLSGLYGSPLRIEFRHKVGGNGSFFFYEGLEGEYIIPNYTKSYPYAYASGLIIAEDCTDCNYCSLKRFSDITLGDYVNGPADYSKSTIFVNTSKGDDFIQTCRTSVVLLEVDLQDVIKKSWHLTKPNLPNKKREKLFSEIDKPWEYLERKYFVLPNRVELIIQAVKSRFRKYMQL